MTRLITTLLTAYAMEIAIIRERIKTDPNYTIQQESDTVRRRYKDRTSQKGKQIGKKM